MFEIRDSADQQSWDLFRDGKHIGYLQWHKTLRLVIAEPFAYVTFEEIRQCVHRLEKRGKKTGGLNWRMT